MYTTWNWYLYCIVYIPPNSWEPASTQCYKISMVISWQTICLWLRQLNTILKIYDRLNKA